MHFRRTNAIIAVLYALLTVVAFFIPLFYHQPLQVEAGDIISAITIVLLLAGAYFAAFYGQSATLIIAWIWVLAWCVRGFIKIVLYPHDFTSTILGGKNPEDRAWLRQTFERAHQTDIQAWSIGLAIPMIALILLVAGHMQIIRKRAKSER